MFAGAIGIFIKGEDWMRWVILTLVLCCLALAGIASGDEAGANNTSTALATDAVGNAVENENTTYIFLQEGTGGSFVEDESGNYTLTITGVVPYTVFFSDRPARDAGFTEMDTFLNGFGFNNSNPPNALVMIKHGIEDSDAIVVELTSPEYNETNSTLTYTAKILNDYVFESKWPEDLLPKVDKTVPESW